MRYSIGEFASILGVTVDTLRLYERQDIIRPLKDHTNNYRYFNDLDARNLLMSRWYRSMNIPLQDVSDLINNATSDRIKDTIKSVQLNLEEEIKRSTLLLNKITEINHELDTISESLNQCQVKQVPGMYRLKQTHKNDLLKEDCLKGAVNAWMELLPFTFYSFRIDNSREDIYGKDGLDYSWGLSLLEDEMHKLDLEINDSVQYIPPAMCVTSVILCDHTEYLMRESFQFMIDFLEASQYTITGDITGKILLNEKIDEESNWYLQINIPISFA